MRQYRAASQTDAATAKAPLPQGALRKCAKGTEVVYTDVACPPGFKERGVSGGTINVVALGGTAQPAPQRRETGKPKSLHDALDLSKDDRLRERMMERAIEASTR